MSRMKYNYDESGSSFYYFIFIVYGFILFIYTYYFVKARQLSLKNTIRKEFGHLCTCKGCTKLKVSFQAKTKPYYKQKRFIGLILGWIAFLFVAYATWAARSSFPEGYDPFIEMGLSSGATEAEIKKQYKLLSLKYHPDRVPEDQKEEAEAKFISISKAYKVLTDEDTRRNFEETGNPDGVYNFTLGIALPSWLVEKDNIYKVLFVYALAFMILFPLFIWRWWRKNKAYTKNNIHFQTMARYFQESTENMNVNMIIEILCTSFEFQERIKWINEDSVIIPALLAKIKAEFEAQGEKFERIKKFNAPFATKTLALFMAHLYRIPIESYLIEDQSFIVQKSFHLLNGMFQIAVARDRVTSAMSIISLGQLIVQAVHDSTAVFMQLPGITDQLMKSIKSKKKSIRSIRDFMEIEPSERRLLLEELNDSEYDNVITVAKTIPTISLVKCVLKVLGQDDITTGSIISVGFYLVITFTSEEEKLLSTIQLDEDESIFGMKETDTAKAKAIHYPFIHAPYFPIQKTHLWWYFLGKPKSNFLSTFPARVTTIPYAADYIPSVSNPYPDYLEPAITTQFSAPKSPGNYVFALTLKCDALLGADFYYEFKVNVVAPKEKQSKTNQEDTSSGSSSDGYSEDD